jgi:hypothetical protein
MIVTITVKWTRRTQPNPKAAAAVRRDPDRDGWELCRVVIFETLRRFPDAIEAVREALAQNRERIERECRNLASPV